MDEQNNKFQFAETDEIVKNIVAEAIAATEAEEPVKKVIIKKKKKKKNKTDKKQMTKKQSDAMTQYVLIGILFVGMCLLCVSLFGIFTALGNNSSNVTDVSAQINQTNTSFVNTEITTSNTDVVINNSIENTTADNADVNDEQDIPDVSVNSPQSDAEWLVFFNNAVNKLKTDGPSFTKAKRTQTADIQLSNPLGQAYVSVAKDKYLSDETVKTEVAKGDKAKAAEVVSPDGESFVSTLEMSDIKTISHSTNADGNYEITIDMPDASNPDKSGSYAKIFQFMLVDDVMDTYAPGMGATVDRENVALEYKGCYAKAVVTPDGKLVSYETKVNANMILKNAKVSVVTTDLDVTLFSDTSYTDITW